MPDTLLHCGDTVVNTPEDIYLCSAAFILVGKADTKQMNRLHVWFGNVKWQGEK